VKFHASKGSWVQGRRWASRLSGIVVAIGASMVVPALVDSVSARQDFSSVYFEREDLGGGLLFLSSGVASNVSALVGSDGVLLVDTQFPGLAPALRTAVPEILETRVTYIVNTHWHGDATGGNGELGGSAEAAAPLLPPPS
jgi:cyclase